MNKGDFRKVKRAFSVIAAILFVIGLFSFTGCSDKNRENILKVFNAADYIAIGNNEIEGVVEEFEKFYREKINNPNFKAVYETFDVNETAITKIEKNKEDWDLVNVSDYAVEKLLNAKLLKTINVSKENMPNYSNISKYVIEQYEKITGMKGDTTYSVGYMWGTMGILYNKAVSETIEEDANSWEALWDKDYHGKVLMKNSVRDSYAAALLYYHREELKNLSSDPAKQSELIDSLMVKANEERINNAKEALLLQKELVDVRYEVDDGKDDIATGNGFQLSLAWSGDAAYAMNEALEGVELDYKIPLEGSNVWFDGWITPVYGKNQAAAEAFIDFLCRPEIALKNMEESGYSTVIATEEILQWHQKNAIEFGIENKINTKYFFGDIAGYDTASVLIDPVFIPDENDIKRCGIMKDFGDETENVLRMWTIIKGTTISPYVYVIIAVIVITGAGLMILYTIKKKNKNKSRLKKK
mgnify:CR=1 FL=1